MQPRSRLEGTVQSSAQRFRRIRASGGPGWIYSGLRDPLLNVRQSFSRLVLPGEAGRGVERRGQRLAGAILVPDLQQCQAEMVLDDRFARKLRRALLEQGSRPLVDAALVEDPTQ